MKSFLIKCAYGVLVLGVVAVSPAQSVWNFQISDAGSGNSLVAWNVTGDLTTLPGPALLLTEPGIASTPEPITVTIDTPGIFANSFSANGDVLPIPTADGSYFATGDIYFPIQQYSATTAPSGGNDIFSLVSAPIMPLSFNGAPFHYVAGTQSIVIPMAFSDFNPGTYSSQQSEFSTPLTVNLTVSPVPEPSPLALFMAGGVGALLLFRSKIIVRA